MVLSEPNKISSMELAGIPVIVIEGDMTSDVDDKVMSLYGEIKNGGKAGRLIFNFQHTSYINSAGIATLINIIQDMNERGAKVSFVGLSNHFLKVMDIVGISDFVDIFETNEEAVSGR